MGDFAAKVAAFVGATKKEIKQVVVQSVVELEAEAMMNLNKLTKRDTGNLINSFTVTIGSPAMQVSAETMSEGVSAAAAAAGFELGQTIHLNVRAQYARRIEYGFVGVDSLGRYYDQQPRPYLRMASQNWDEIVSRNARRAQARAGFAQS
ncbi:HK97 gp10 family phage protein [Fulvimarina endophytica]|uniref:HK97 gp10 family phage protein n=1 Tax=Fulvimarina endophytica TaxID=2293836 RepID=A0A371XB83_9HYPH|nr:HK97 gp10 family phage protein [Fulvimarina endophytica]RFC66451.1 HK97 gp10 family phage protein [Fulvimarina endophytica]